MKRLLRNLLRAAFIGAALLVMAVASRRYWLPERFAVNVPLQAILGGDANAATTASPESLHLPPGFSLTRFATGLPNARFMRVTARGDVLVSQPREGLVTLVFADTSGDGVSDGSAVLLSGLNRPHGLALRDGYLYVGEMTAVARVRFDEAARAVSGEPERVITGLPSGGNHWTRSLGFGPDGFLYVSVGSSCNVCIEEDSRRAAMLRFDPATWKGSVFASGLRNSVGFAWRATSDAADAPRELFATDNGRDLLGDNFPPCELNRVVEGGFYGWPFASGDRVKDPDFGAGHETQIAASLPPAHQFGAHNAPLGIAFLDAASTPAAYRGAAVVALHGSWNRTSKDGYNVVSLHWDASGKITQRDFLTGFLRNETVIGRPVDVAQGADGAIFISDDFTGAIYRIAATASVSAAATPANAEIAAPATSPAPAKRVSFDPAAVKRGAAVFEENMCKLCHDPEVVARGESPVEKAKILEKLTARYDVEKMITYLKAPQPPMPLFEMSDKERRDLAMYVLQKHQ